MNNSKKHSKHIIVTKPNGGRYHRNEWCLIGAPCDTIANLCTDINSILQNQLNIGYLDEAHQSNGSSEGFELTHADAINYTIIKNANALPFTQVKNLTHSLDVLLINGNHYRGEKQIVIIDEKKRLSLSKKLDRLTNVKMIIFQKSADEIYDFIQAHLPMQTIPIVAIDDKEKIASIIKDDFLQKTPDLFTLILAGGKSTRMGVDKGSIAYRGIPQREYQADIANQFCQKTFISITHDQDIVSKYEKLIDTFADLGPFGGILSAFRAYPNSAWMTLACDLPYLNEETISLLTKSRNPSKLATCFHNPDTGFPEPLITIWEPRAYPVLLNYLGMGYACPRKILINSNIEELKLNDCTPLKNVNDPESKNAALNYINSSKF